MENISPELKQLVDSLPNQIPVFLTDGAKIGSIPELYLSELAWYNASRSVSSHTKPSVILLPTYTKLQGEFFIYVMKNMYFHLDFTPQTLVWFYKINDELGLPSEIFQKYKDMRVKINPFGNAKAMEQEEHILIEHSNVFDILAEIYTMCNNNTMLLTPDVIALETKTKTWMTEHFKISLITSNSVCVAKTRNFICHLLKTLQTSEDEDEILGKIIDKLEGFDHELPDEEHLTEKCLNDVLACVHWCNVTQEFATIAIDRLTNSCPNFKLNNTIINNLKKRQILVNKYDKQNKLTFKYNPKIHSTFPVRPFYDYSKTIVGSEKQEIYVYSTMVNPSVVKFEVKIGPSTKQPGTKFITIVDTYSECPHVKLTITYVQHEITTELTKKWKFHNKLFFINIPENIDEDTVRIIFNEVIVKKREERENENDDSDDDEEGGDEEQ